VKKLWRIMLLSTVALLSILPAGLAVPRAYAGADPAAASPAKKKSKYKKSRTKKQKILKGRHGKHNRSHV
jgi:hypothetical protein